MAHAAGLLEICPVLREVFDEGLVRGPAGETQPVHSNIGLLEAEALYHAVLKYRPTMVVEIGMAFGTSSLAILAALEQSGGQGRLISIDPNQSSEWMGGGVAAIARSGFAKRHRLIEEPDYVALPQLLASGTRIEFAFIDGWHTFDYALLDFWYLDKLLVPGGVVGFDDCNFPSVRKVIKFVLSHRKYQEMDLGLPVSEENYAGTNGMTKRLLGSRLLTHIRRMA